MQRFKPLNRLLGVSAAALVLGLAAPLSVSAQTAGSGTGAGSTMNTTGSGMGTGATGAVPAPPLGGGPIGSTGNPTANDRVGAQNLGTPSINNNTGTGTLSSPSVTGTGGRGTASGTFTTPGTPTTGLPPRIDQGVGTGTMPSGVDPLVTPPSGGDLRGATGGAGSNTSAEGRD